MQLTVAMISMNAQGEIGQIVDGLQAALPEAEIVLVDSSSDATPDIAAFKGALVVRQFPPQGSGRALERALRQAHGDVVITLGSDGSYPIEMIPRLLELVLEEGYDVVNTTRLTRRPPGMPVLRYFGARTCALLATLLSGTWTTDLHSDMRAYRTAMLDRLDFNTTGPALAVELWLKPILLGFRAAEVPIALDGPSPRSRHQGWEAGRWTLKRLCRCYRWRRETIVRGSLAEPRIEHLRQ